MKKPEIKYFNLMKSVTAKEPRLAWHKLSDEQRTQQAEKIIATQGYDNLTQFFIDEHHRLTKQADRTVENIIAGNDNINTLMHRDLYPVISNVCKTLWVLAHACQKNEHFSMEEYMTYMSKDALGLSDEPELAVFLPYFGAENSMIYFPIIFPEREENKLGLVVRLNCSKAMMEMYDNAKTLILDKHYAMNAYEDVQMFTEIDNNPDAHLVAFGLGAYPEPEAIRMAKQTYNHYKARLKWESYLAVNSNGLLYGEVKNTTDAKQWFQEETERLEHEI